MQLFLIILSSILWGATNPFIRRATFGIERIQHQNKNLIEKVYFELKFLFTNYNYLIPFIINQLGSVFFYITLSNSNLSLVVPLTNSLTLFFTTLTGIFLGEQICNIRKIFGFIFVTFGICICVSSTY